MKQQVIYLEPHDDILSARDKLSWARADQVLVVLPDGEAVFAFRNRVGIVLLQREAVRLHTQIAIISSDPVVRDHCGALKVPCFATINQSRKTAWVTGPQAEAQVRAANHNREFRESSTPQTILPANDQRQVSVRTILVIGSLIILISVLLFAPGATVTIRPRSEVNHYSIMITADPTLVDIDVDSAAIPCRSIVVEVEASATVDATGVVDFPTSNATGQLAITNQLPDQLAIPAGTVFVSETSPPVRFRSLFDSTLPGRIGETITVDIEAIDPGKSGNLGRNLITGIEGSLANSVSITNPESTRGGHSTQSIAISNEDRVRVRSLVVQQMFQRAHAEIQISKEIGMLASENIPLETLQVAHVQSEDYSGDVGDQAITVSLQMQAVIQGIAIDERSARQVAYQKLLSTEYGVTPVDISSLVFAMGPVTDIDDDRRVTFSMEASTAYQSTFGIQTIQGLTVGMTVEQAEANLTNHFSPVADSVIEVWPPFWPFTPLIRERIRVEVDEEK